MIPLILSIPFLGNHGLSKTQKIDSEIDGSGFRADSPFYPMFSAPIYSLVLGIEPPLMRLVMACRYHISLYRLYQTQNPADYLTIIHPEYHASGIFISGIRDLKPAVIRHVPGWWTRLCRKKWGGHGLIKI